MEYCDLKLLLLHEHPQYLKECCVLINQEWPRSETARMMSLQASCDQLPTSLILVRDGKVLGHCKLTSIPSMPNSCFIETVVICKSMRGKKLGTYLMQQVEDYCKNVLKLEMVHLSTKGQENFYAKLGYELCAPVSIYGNNVTSFKAPEIKRESLPQPKNTANNGTTPLPPPPPPMPTITSGPISTIKTCKTFMFKYLK
ncbi:N-alpha-acetyltransferase 80 [Epargyreus clarus]|uniref:N-alpha-acetyltransferase 80 n=1 Tax=Epargyreus clarus TaxID=520877 RepID=UPI003C2BE89A